MWAEDVDLRVNFAMEMGETCIPVFSTIYNFLEWEEQFLPQGDSLSSVMILKLQTAKTIDTLGPVIFVLITDQY